MNLWRGLLAYLIIGEEGSGRPSWYPADLFEISETRLSSEWHFAFFGQKEEHWLSAVWGYEELLNSDHYDQLANLEPAALRVFEIRRKQIEADRNG